MPIRTCLTLLVLLVATAGTPAPPRRDGAVIRTTGSTNSAAYAIKIWSDGSALVTVAGRSPRAFRVDRASAARFFSAAQAARSDPGTFARCMKSVSFGTHTTVSWHNYTSYDLQCPPFSPSVARLASAVAAIQAAAHLQSPMRRIPLPRDVRMIPTAAPEIHPT